MARPRQFDEDAVLHAVCEQFWDAGYAATSLQDLMRVSGLGKGSLYAAFGDKHELFLRVLGRYADSLLLAVRRSIDAAPRAVNALRAFVMTPVAGNPTCRSARRGCLLANSTTELAFADPAVLALARRTYEGLTDVLSEGVARARVEGDLSSSCAPVELARALLAAQQGLTFMGRTGMQIEELTTTARSLVDRLLPTSTPGDGIVDALREPRSERTSA